MASLEEKIAEAVRIFPVLYDKSNVDFKDRNKKGLAWQDVATKVFFGYVRANYVKYVLK